jgi:hypothetical protein
MAIYTAPPVRGADPVVSILVDVSAILMAGHTLRRTLRNQEEPVVRTMGLVTGKAILPYGRMFPKKGPPLFLVATVAGFVRDASFQHSAARVSMHVVTGGTIDSALSDGVMRGLVHLGADVGVAFVTQSCFTGA